MSTRPDAANASFDQRRAGWLFGLAVLAATMLLGRWTAIHIEPDHAGFYLLIVSAFLVSTAPIRGIGAG